VRLTLVELRKMTDTRAGFWLQCAVVALTLAIAGILVGFGETSDQTFETMLEAAMQPSVNLLPVIGTLLVSSEWSQRTAQQTFTLVPKRTRVISSKLLASLVVAAAAFAMSIVVALLAPRSPARRPPARGRSRPASSRRWVCSSRSRWSAASRSARCCSPQRPRSSPTSWRRRPGPRCCRSRPSTAWRRGWTARTRHRPDQAERGAVIRR